METDERDKLVAGIGLHVLHHFLFHVVDKKTFKVLWELHKKVRICLHLAPVVNASVQSVCNKCEII